MEGGGRGEGEIFLYREYVYAIGGYSYEHLCFLWYFDFFHLAVP